MKKSVIGPCNIALNKQSYKITIDEVINSKTYVRYSHNQIQRFHDESQIINCVSYMERNLKFQKLLNLYFLLFQIAVSHTQNLCFTNFLTQYQFTRKLNQTSSLKCQQTQKLILKVIAKFLDCFKQNKDVKIRINNLLHQYHQYRILQNEKQNKVIVQTCQLIKQYVTHNLNFLINQIKYSNWEGMNQSSFKIFYQKYSQICTIIKRASYLKCSLIKLPIFQIPEPLRTSIQQISSKIAKRETILKEQTEQKIKEQSQKLVANQTPKKTVISVKKKLKALSSMIVKMEQHLDFTEILIQPNHF